MVVSKVHGLWSGGGGRATNVDDAGDAELFFGLVGW